jgi:hypothetical protein
VTGALAEALLDLDPASLDRVRSTERAADIMRPDVGGESVVAVVRRGAEGRIRGLPRLRRNQPAIQMQNPRSVISAFGGNGFLVSRTHAR